MLKVCCFTGSSLANDMEVADLSLVTTACALCGAKTMASELANHWATRQTRDKRTEADRWPNVTKRGKAERSSALSSS